MDDEVQESDCCEDDYDLVTCPAHNDKFEEIFMQKGMWYAVKVNENKIPNLKYVAIYRSAPVSAITHYAKIVCVVPDIEEAKKKRIILDGNPVALNNMVKLGDYDPNCIRSPRYTKLSKLLKACVIKNLF